MNKRSFLIKTTFFGAATLFIPLVSLVSEPEIILTVKEAQKLGVCRVCQLAKRVGFSAMENRFTVKTWTTDMTGRGFNSRDEHAHLGCLYSKI